MLIATALTLGLLHPSQLHHSAGSAAMGRAASSAIRASEDATAGATTASTGADFVARKAALVEGLRREYDSFFRPMEENLYAPSVTFTDPLISFEGVAAYKSNVNMLAGESALGRFIFTDCGLVMHTVTTDSPESRSLCTRWTLQFRFKLLPWKPLAQFTGVSQYTLDDQVGLLLTLCLVSHPFPTEPPPLLVHKLSTEQILEGHLG